MAEKDLGDIFGEETEAGGEGIDLGGEPAAPEGGEGMTLDADLAGMLGDSSAGGGEDAPAGLDLGETEGGADAGAGGGEDAGGGGLDLGGLLGGGEETGGGGESGVPAPAAGGVSSQADGLAHSKQTLSSREAVNLDFLLDVKLDVTFEVGRSKMLISDLLTLGQGSVVELHRLVGEELDLLVNGKLIAKGEVVVVNEKFGCKIAAIVSPEERVKHLGAVQ